MENTKIQWTESTWNPWHGCSKVSAGCKFCYMFRDKERYGQSPTKVLKSKSMFNQPLKWKEPKIIFTCSWSDWFIEEADAWRDEAWEIIRRTPHHTYQILTKRPERIKDNLPSFFDELENVWIGVSVESQEFVGRIAYLNELSCITFASFEPLLGEIKWNENMNQLDWCIIGGESGNDNGKYKYRPMEMQWVENLITDVKANHVKCFVKQLGTHQAKILGLKDRHGGNIKEWEEKFQVREFPVRKVELINV
jgi:protein gp37